MLTKEEVEYWFVRVSVRGGMEYTAMVQPLDDYADIARDGWKFEDLEDAKGWVMQDLARRQFIMVRYTNDSAQCVFINADIIDKISFLPFKRVWKKEEDE